MSRFLVTGCADFIGSHVTSALLDAGHEVVGVDNLVATQRLFVRAAEVGIRVVFASSSSVYGDAEVYPTNEDVFPRPISPYGITPHACEHSMLAAAGTAVAA